jgi:hypothetical protein
MTTEQALRRLKTLGFSNDDKPIKNAVKYMANCLNGKMKIPDREEKAHNWNVYTELMLSTWIRIFTTDNTRANTVAENWRNIITGSFAGGKYDHNEYINNYQDTFKIKLNPKAGRLVDFVHFYPVSLLTNLLDKKTEAPYFQYILEHNSGLYYVYERKLSIVPRVFQSKTTSRYIRAVELLARYDNSECKKQLTFIVKWLKENMIRKSEWDMGKESKDSISFPLSDSWRSDENRIKDCSFRIGKLIERIEK